MRNETTVTLTTDGATRDNQYPSKRRSGFGYVIEHNDETIAEEYQYIGQDTAYTSNFAEYQAVIIGVKNIKERFADRQINLRLRSDSELIIKQLNGEYSVNKMREQYELCLDELDSLANWQAEQVSEAPGNNVDHADTLASKSFE
jgi:probable phosphoglycerate mutase